MKERYGHYGPKHLASLYRDAESYLLTDRQVTIWSNKVKAEEANSRLVLQYLKDLDRLSEKGLLRKYGKNEDKHPQLTARAKSNKVYRTLDRHQWAVAFMAWYWRLPAKQRLIRKARHA